MICSYCGILIPEGINLCPNCGNAVESSDIGKTRLISEVTTITKEGVTTLYTQEDLGKTIILREEKDPIFGWLVILEGEKKWEDYRLPNKDCQIIIGSGDDADIVIRGQNIEKRHISLRIREGKLFLTDLDTESGTYVNDEQIIKKELEDGNLIRLGNTIIKFKKL